MVRDELIKIKKADISMDHSLVIHIAKAVADFRRDKLRLSERQFAEKVGISRRTLNNIEKGRSRKYSIHTIDKIISSLGVSLLELFDGMIYLQNPAIEGTLKGEYKIEYPEGLKIFSFFPQNKAFFFGSPAVLSLPKDLDPQLCAAAFRLLCLYRSNKPMLTPLTRFDYSAKLSLYNSDAFQIKH